MLLILLGVLFIGGIFAFYMLSEKIENNEDMYKYNDDLKEEDNVIYLPSDIEKVKANRRKRKHD